MRRVITGGDLSQREMRPPDLLNAYLALVEKDVKTFKLLDTHGERRCPGCGGAGEPAFERLGFTYQRCGSCESLFLSPLPDRALLERYHREGRAERFWREEVLPATASVRSRHALGPRAHWVAATAAAHLGVDLVLCDLGSRDPRIWEFLAASPTFAKFVTEEAAGSSSADVVVAFDTLERADNLKETLSRCRRLLCSNGLLFASTLSGNGFEVRLLGGRMRSLVPPVHLQLLSRAGWVAALEPSGFGLLEYSTPGELDVQAVAEACRRDSEVKLPPIIDELIRQDDEEISQTFQELLQQAGLSAHVQFVALAKT